MMLSTKQTAARLVLCDSRVRQLCIQGRLPGAIKIGRDWLVPKDSMPTRKGKP
jgi:hypothetical protein